MKTGFFSGSFDPPTYGHFDIVRRSLQIVDKLIIGIGVSDTKQALFSIQERISMLKAEIHTMEDQRIEIHPFDGLLIDVVLSLDVSLIIRGLRNSKDYEYESSMAMMNRKMSSRIGIDTIFLTASPENVFISSTQLRQIIRMGKDVSMFVPCSVFSIIKDKTL